MSTAGSWGWVALFVALFALLGYCLHKMHEQTAMCGPFALDLRKKRLRRGFQEIPLAGCVVTLEAGVGRSRVTGTRVIGGALVAGPVGALVGAGARKDLTRIYLTLVTGEGEVFDWDVPASSETAARRFMREVNRLAVAS